MTTSLQRTLVRYIKPGDLVKTYQDDVKIYQDDYAGFLIVLCIKLLDRDTSVANITFLNSKNKVIQSSGWIMLYKVTTKKKINNE